MENKLKINTGLASIILVASLFAGWQTMLIVTILMFLFCEVDERVKQVATSVITFYVGYTIVSTGWTIIMNVADLIVSTINNFVAYIVKTFELYDFDISILMTPLGIIIKLLDNGVSILLSIVKLGFVIGILTGKPSSSNPLSSKINEYVNKAINYVNGNVAKSAQPMPQQPMPQQAAPVNNMPNVGQQPMPPQQGPNQNM
ncbi:MAG TPA: hypothetical protein DCE23_06850 [Firmicutes bacterium]|nr:hypothetical protein [Bacillota bacterium]